MAKIINTADLDRRNTGLDANELEWTYNGLDCCVTREVFDVIEPQLDDVSAGVYAFSKALQAPVLEMAQRGILVNEQRRQESLRLFRDRERRLAAQLDELVDAICGFPVNWRSPLQLRWLLYDIMQLPVQRKRNAQGRMAPSTDRESLEKLRAYFVAEPVVNHLLALRDVGKKIGFLETEIDSDQRIRTNFNIAGTNTGRLASAMSDFGTGTNLQNVDKDLRSVFVADRGMKLANLDLEQADSRNLGAMLWNIFGDGTYLDACESGDLHTAVCKMAWRDLSWGSASDREVADAIAYRNMTYRDLAKRLGHGSNYCGQPATMARHTKVEQHLIREFQTRYFAAFRAIQRYPEWVKEQLHDSASLTTAFQCELMPYGRRRFFFGRPNDDATIREAVAYCPQSMTADEIDWGLIKIWRANRVQVLCQVHDSILIQYPEEQEDEVVPWALEQLRTEIPLARGRSFAVPTEAKVGYNWGDFSEENPDGLAKWTGHDRRKRSENVRGKKWSLWGM